MSEPDEFEAEERREALRDRRSTRHRKTMVSVTWAVRKTIVSVAWAVAIIGAGTHMPSFLSGLFSSL